MTDETRSDGDARRPRAPADRRDPYGLAAIRALRVLPLRATFRVAGPLELPEFAGSTVRGALGHALKDAVCVTSERRCARCAFVDECTYPYLFETPRAPSATRLQGVPRAPAPFRLRVPAGPRTVEPGDELTVGVDLFGRATELLPSLVAALDGVGRRGVGAARVPASLVDVVVDDEAAPDVVYRGGRISPVRARSGGSPVGLRLDDGRAEVRFDAPARVRHAGRLAEELPFHVLVRSLLRRASSLLEFHEGVDLDVDYRRVIAESESVRVVVSRLVGVDRWRFSTRQQRSMNLNGLIGSVTYEGDLAPFSPLLELGAAVGIGKGTTFGLGRMSVVAAGVPVASESEARGRRSR